MNAVPRLMRLLLIAALGAGLAGCGGGSSQDSPPASPLRLENAAAVTQTIGPAGGTLTTTAADGTAYTLTVPPTALRRATAITLAPIASIADLPAGVSLAGGVHLTPEGQAFDMPVKLTIALARPPSGAPIPFTYADALMQRRLYPAVLTAGTLAFDIVHFSGYAALLAQPDVIAFLLGGNGYLPTPGAAGDMALQQLVSAALGLTGDARGAAMRAALRGWLDGVIKPAVVAVQATASIDLNPPASAALLALTRLRNEMQVFDIALKFTVLAGGGAVDVVYGDFSVAVRDAALHATALFNAACSSTADPIGLAVPDIFAWQQVAHVSGASTLAPALERAAVLDALCVQVAYDPNGGTDFPSGIQPGQTGTLGVRAGYTVNGGPVRFDAAMNIAARGSNTSTDPLRGAGEPVAAGATYQQQFLWLNGTSEMRIAVTACLQDLAVREICQQAFVVRGAVPAGGAKLTTRSAGISLYGNLRRFQSQNTETLLSKVSNTIKFDPFVPSLADTLPIPAQYNISATLFGAARAGESISRDPTTGMVSSGNLTGRVEVRCAGTSRPDGTDVPPGGYVDEVWVEPSYFNTLDFTGPDAGATLVVSGWIRFSGAPATQDHRLNAEVSLNGEVLGRLSTTANIETEKIFSRTLVLQPLANNPTPRALFDVRVNGRCHVALQTPRSGDRAAEVFLTYTFTPN